MARPDGLSFEVVHSHDLTKVDNCAVGDLTLGSLHRQFPDKAPAPTRSTVRAREHVRVNPNRGRGVEYNARQRYVDAGHVLVRGAQGEIHAAMPFAVDVSGGIIERNAKLYLSPLADKRHVWIGQIGMDPVFAEHIAKVPDGAINDLDVMMGAAIAHLNPKRRVSSMAMWPYKGEQITIDEIRSVTFAKQSDRPAKTPYGWSEEIASEYWTARVADVEAAILAKAGAEQALADAGVVLPSMLPHES